MFLGILKIFCKFHRETEVLESLFNEVAGQKASNFIKKETPTRCFLVKFAKLSRTPFFTEQLRWLLLNIPQNLEEKTIKSVLF